MNAHAPKLILEGSFTVAAWGPPKQHSLARCLCLGLLNHGELGAASRSASEDVPGL